MHRAPRKNEAKFVSRTLAYNGNSVDRLAYSYERGNQNLRDKL